MKSTATAATNIVAQKTAFIVSCKFVAHTFWQGFPGKD